MNYGFYLLGWIKNELSAKQILNAVGMDITMKQADDILSTKQRINFETS